MTDTQDPNYEAQLDEAELNAEHGLDADPETLLPLDQIIAERDEWKDRALRAAAEADNVRRRTETQMNDARAYAIQRFAKDLLGVADTLERALAADPASAHDPAVSALMTGMELTRKSLLQAFENNGLKRVAPGPGDAFDPHLHQAMVEQPSTEVPGGTVVQTMQAGFELFGRTVRPAMVVVAAKGSGPQGTNPYGSASGGSGGTFDGKA